MSFNTLVELYTSAQLTVLGALSALLHMPAEQGPQKPAATPRAPAKKPPKPFKEMTAAEYDKYLTESGL